MARRRFGLINSETQQGQVRELINTCLHVDEEIIDRFPLKETSEAVRRIQIKKEKFKYITVGVNIQSESRRLTQRTYCIISTL
jgi:hypothetical protein